MKMTDQLGWAQSGQLNVNPDGSVGSGKSMSMQANFANSRYGAGSWTLEFDLNAGVFPATLYAAEAEITWSVAGNSVRRCVDVRSGISVTGVAEAVHVRIADKGLYYGPPGPTAQDLSYFVSVQTTKGIRAGWEQPPLLTGPTFFLDNTESFLIEVPKNCGVLSYFLLAAPTAGGVFDNNLVVVRQFDAVLGTVSANTLSNIWIPIARNTTQISVLNTAVASGQLSCSVIWGIDG